MRGPHGMVRHEAALRGGDGEIEHGAERGGVRGGEAQLVPERDGEERRAPERVLEADGGVVAERAEARDERGVREVVRLGEDPSQTRGVVLQQTPLALLRDRGRGRRAPARGGGRAGETARRAAAARGLSCLLYTSPSPRDS